MYGRISLYKMVEKQNVAGKGVFWLVFYFKLNEERGFANASEADDGFERNPAAYFVVYEYGLPKPELLDAVIYFHLQVLHIHNLFPEIRYESECKVAVRNSSFEGTFIFGPFCVDMYPLMIESGIGEVIDLFLGYLMPAGYADFFTQVGFEFCMTSYNYHQAKIIE